MHIHVQFKTISSLGLVNWKMHVHTLTQHTHTHTHTHTHIHTHTHTHTHIHNTHTCACAHTHTHTHTQCTCMQKRNMKKKINGISWNPGLYITSPVQSSDCILPCSNYQGSTALMIWVLSWSWIGNPYGHGVWHPFIPNQVACGYKDKLVFEFQYD